MTTRKRTLPKYHRDEHWDVDDLAYIENDYYDGIVNPYAPAPEVPNYYTILSAEELHAYIDTLTQWAKDSGLTDIYFEGWSGGLGGYRPLTPAERQAAKQKEAKAAIASAKRKETNAKRKAARTAKEEEKQRNLLRVLAKKYPEEVQAVNAFED